ncbi:Hypothetical protein NTJ_07898 [Nesidiocoris tenuis]|uniref:DUF4794 domain-containing protein n=2 Tax=Nesidiocoris tenuis TaxID=355587 RepID=A0ABN7AUA2_9HEMI|nr:Hypothetical protein NTJ_07898 [Nesidiocoris tenuis]
MRRPSATTLLNAFMISCAAAMPMAPQSAPVYDQRQEGNTNVHAQLENVVVLLVPPAGMGLLNLVEMAAKSAGLGNKPDSTAVGPAIGPHDEKYQRDPDYVQVPDDKHYAFQSPLSDEQRTTDRQPTASSPSPSPTPTSSPTPPAETTDVTQPPPVVAMDAVTAHSAKLALYSQFRSANPPQHIRKHNRYSNSQINSNINNSRR